MFDFVEYSLENLLYLYTQWTEAGLADEALVSMTTLSYVPFIMAVGCVFEVVKAFFVFCCSMCKSRGRE